MDARFHLDLSLIRPLAGTTLSRSTAGSSPAAQEWFSDRAHERRFQPRLHLSGMRVRPYSFRQRIGVNIELAIARCQAIKRKKASETLRFAPYRPDQRKKSQHR